MSDEGQGSGQVRLGFTGAAPPKERSIQRALAQHGAGQPLPAEVVEHFGAAFGSDLSGVRIHTGGASEQANQDARSDGFTYGQDVFLRQGISLDTTEGLFVIGHELAHVAQQGTYSMPQRDGKAQAPELAATDDEHEMAADTAAADALVGKKAAPGRAAPKVRFLAQGDGSARKQGHAYMTEQTLKKMGLSDQVGRDRDGQSVPAETRQARMGNWERDLSQVINPTTAPLVQAIWPLLNIVAIKEFGRGIQGTSFGSYDPVEHLDNPTGLRGDDVLAQGPRGSTNIDGSGTNQADHYGGDLKPAGGNDEACADVDARYKAGMSEGKLADGQRVRGEVMNPGDAAAYQVDESAVPRYISTSRAWCIDTLHHAAVLGRGRGSQGVEHLRGPQLFASGVHVLQDYFAHSNFCEIAINILIREKSLSVPEGGGKKRVLDGSQILDTQVHKNDAKGNAMSGNLTYVGREVLSTGSFNLSDTLASLLEEVSDKWKLLDPFAEGEKGPSPLVMACLDYLEMDPKNPTQFSKLSDKIHSLLTGVADVVENGAGNSIVRKGSNIAGKGVELAGAGTGKLLRSLGWLARKVGWQSGEEALRSSGNSVEQSLDHAAEAVKNLPEQFRKLSARIREIAAPFKGRQHLVRSLYVWLYDHNPLTAIKEAIAKIPKVGPWLVTKIEEVQQQLRSLIKAALQPAWKAVQDAGTKKLNAIIGQVRGQTNIQTKKSPVSKIPIVAWMQKKLGNVSDMYDQRTGKPINGIAPASYTPPSHTQVAKDHGDLADKESHMDEQGSDVHEHEAGWLYQMATVLASRATDRAGTAVHAVWDYVDAQPPGTKLSVETPLIKPLLDPIDRAVQQTFAHPADCRSFWEPSIRTLLAKPDVAARFLAKLQPT